MISNSYFALVTLTSISLLTFMDKTTTGAVLIQIHDYFKLSSAQAGLLGTLYPVGAVLAGPFFGYMGDRCPRKWIIIGALVFWNLSSLGVSQITNQQYYFLFMARFFAGAGTAGFYTVVNSCIADLFSVERRKMAFSVFYMVSMIGVGLGFMTGSLVSGNWRWAYRIAPGICIPFLVALTLISEPKRGCFDGATKALVDTDSAFTNLAQLLKTPSFVWTTIGYTWFEFYEVSFSLWAVSFLMYAQPHMSDSIPSLFGAFISVLGPIGVCLGAWASRKLARRHETANLLVCAVGVLGGAVFLFIFLSVIASGPQMGWLAFVLGVASLSMILAPLMETLVEVIVPNKRAFADSIQQVVAHLLGSSTGPYFVGLLKSWLELRMDNKFHAFYLALMAPLVALVLSGLAFLRAIRYYAADKRRAQESTQEEIVKSEKNKLTMVN